MKFEVRFYETIDGKKPVEDFLLGLENKMQAKMVQMMELLEEKGTDLREPYTKRVCQEFCVNRFNKQHRIAA